MPLASEQHLLGMAFHSEERTGSVRPREPVCRLGHASGVRNTSGLQVASGFLQVLLLPSNEIVSSEVNDSTRVSEYTNLLLFAWTGGGVGGEVFNVLGPWLPRVTFAKALASEPPGDERGVEAGNSTTVC